MIRILRHAVEQLRKDGCLASGLVVIALFLFAMGCAMPSSEQKCAVGRMPSIFPDYRQITIPPNIAPLNFSIQEKGDRYRVTITGTREGTFSINSNSPNIRLPLARWRGLLKRNRGAGFTLAIAARVAGSWQNYAEIRNSIANETIDPYLVYRRLPVCVQWENMGIYQRNLQSFEEKIVIHNRSLDKACMNCHSFRHNSPDTMALQIRHQGYGTPMLIRTSNPELKPITAISTKTALSHGKAGFTSWHPTKDILAFSLNEYVMFTHNAGQETRDVFDKKSDLALYVPPTCQVVSNPALTSPDLMETMPEWSPDGKFLYFVRGPQVSFDEPQKVQCDLMRIAFDANTITWGKLDTVVPWTRVGGSITQPRFSPDGAYLLFTVSDYSDFPIHQKRSDLFLMNMASGALSPLDINSPWCESWHGWSSNGRWIVFNSKRMDGRHSRIHFCFFDASGKVHKPFMLPLEDPTIYSSQFLVYNIPELLVKPISLTTVQIKKALDTFDKRKGAIDGAGGATPKGPDPTPPSEDHMLQGQPISLAGETGIIG